MNYKYDLKDKNNLQWEFPIWLLKLKDFVRFLVLGIVTGLFIIICYYFIIGRNI